MMEARITRIEEDLKKDSISREKIYDRLGKLENHRTEIDVKLANIEVSLAKIEQKLDELRLAPGNQWKQIINDIIRSVIPILIAGLVLYLNR